MSYIPPPPRNAYKNIRKLQFSSKGLDLNVKSVVGEQNLAWDRYKKLLEKPDISVVVLLKKSESLLEICKKTLKVVKTDAIKNRQLTYFRRTDKLKAKANSSIGNQKLISHKMCLYYAASKALGKKKEAVEVSKTYLKLYDELIGTKISLDGSELNTADVVNKLADIKNLIDNLYKKRKDFIGTKVSLEKVITTTGNLESLFSEVTEYYSLL